MVVMAWSLPAYGMIIYQTGVGFDDVGGLSESWLAAFGSIILSGWLMVALWLTNGKMDQRQRAGDGGAFDDLSSNAECVDDGSATQRRGWLSRNQWFCLGLIATIILMIAIARLVAPGLSFIIAGAILWTTLSALPPSLYRQLTGRPIRYRPDLDEAAWEPTSSLGIRGLLVLTFCIAAAIAAARRMAGGDLVPLYLPAAMGSFGGLVWLTMIFSSIARKRRFVPLAIALTVIEAIVVGQLILLSPTIQSDAVDAAILFVVSVRLVGWVFLSIMRASGYRM